MNRVWLCRAWVCVLAAGAALVCLPAPSQTGDTATLDQEKLVSEIKLTKSTADHSDIVTAGDTVLLHKDGLMMCSVDSSYAFSNTYNNGVLVGDYNNRAKDTKAFGSKATSPSADNVDGCRQEWLHRAKVCRRRKILDHRVDLLKDGIIVATFSDPYNDSSGDQVRYYGEIKIPVPQGPGRPSARRIRKDCLRSHHRRCPARRQQ